MTATIPIGSIDNAARRYIADGWNVVPVISHGKRPYHLEWEQLRIDDGAVSVYFRPTDNIGAILGEASGGRVCVDLDSEAARQLAPLFLPPTPLVRGRKQNPNGHWFYRVDGKLPGRKWRLSNDDKKTFGFANTVELLGDGQQVVVGPSVHETGDVYDDIGDEEPATVTAAKLIAACVALDNAVRAKLGIDAEQPKRQLTEKTPSSHAADSSREASLKRASAYLAKIPPAISGQGGHPHTFRTAIKLVAFGLSRDDVFDLLADWNRTCQPPWSDAELWHKIEDAFKADPHPMEDRPNGTADQPRQDQSEGEPLVAAEADDDPHRLGRLYLDAYGQTETGDPTVVFFQGEFYRWERAANSYERIPAEEIRREITKSAKNQLDAIALVRLREHLASGSNDTPPVTKRVTRSLVSNVLGTVESMTGLPSKQGQPCWLIPDEPPFNADEILVTRNGLVHLPSLGTERPSLLPPTPLFFSTNAIGCDFNPQAECPEWLKFLATVWDDDEQSINTLAEWFGYLLLCDVRHHRILLLVGPPRSGKGTIGRVLKLLLGGGSVANPTLNSLAGPFGLWPLHNKMAAIISDARLSGHVDAMTILERLLSISGGDPQNIDRKCLPSLTSVAMAVRFTIMTNEIPRLTDASGAIASRFIILQMTRSFLGCEDKELDRNLAAELPGILNWSIRGWQRLRNRGHFIQPESASDLAEDLRDIASPVGMFVREVCVTGPERSVDVADLYAAWCDWCTEHGREQPGTEQTFGKDLRAAVPSLQVARPRISGNRVRRYNGVGLKPPGPQWSATQTIAPDVEKGWIN